MTGTGSTLLLLLQAASAVSAQKVERTRKDGMAGFPRGDGLFSRMYVAVRGRGTGLTRRVPALSLVRPLHRDMTVMPATPRVALSALLLLGVSACGGSEEPGSSYQQGSIVGPWTITAIGGAPLPTVVPNTGITLFSGTASFVEAGTFIITYNAAMDGHNIVIQVKGTWVADGATFRLFGASTLDGEPLERGYTNTGAVPDHILTLHASPAETWERPS